MDEHALTKAQEHLKLLSIFHYVVGGMLFLFSLFPIIHLVIGIVFLVAPPQSKGGGPPPALFGAIFVVVASLAIVMGMALSGLVLFSGFNLSRGRRYVLCLVTACLLCLWMPLGTILGVFTLVVLMKDEAKCLFRTGEWAEDEE